MAHESKDHKRQRIHKRLRRRLRGTPERPRLAVFRSLNHIYAQVIDDAPGRDQALAGLPYLVVDDEDPVVAVGGQLAPRVAVQHGGGARRGGR